MQLTYEFPETLEQDLNRFREEVEKFKKGETSFVKFRSFRVPQGVYEQREDGFFMLRIRLPAGGIFPGQMKALAVVAKKYGSNVLHVTTRQDIQVHRVPLENIHSALVALYHSGLSTKGGGGNTVRNITGCYDAGVCEKEAFDISGYSMALTGFMLLDSASFNLPRKFKIAFSGCPEDCAGVMVNDLGFIAKKLGSKEGFSVYAGGGLGSVSRTAKLLEEFVSANEIHVVAEAVKRAFDKHGNRKNKHKARLRFLIDKIGFDEFKNLYQAELAVLRNACLPELKLISIQPVEHKNIAKNIKPESSFQTWRNSNVIPQKQKGFFLVQVPLILGDINADILQKLAEIIESVGEGMVRTTQWQNMVIRWVAECDLPLLHKRLKNIGLAEPYPPIIRNTVACAGAATCKLGICLSRGMAGAILSELSKDGINLQRLGDIKLHISGCPNACSRHPIADIGLFGGARRINGHLAPYYVIQTGGSGGENKTHLARGSKSVAARNIPRLINDLLLSYQNSEYLQSFDTFLEAHGEMRLKELIIKHSYVPPLEEDKNYYYDWGSDVLFTLAGREPGECGAGVFDLIEVDINSAKDAMAQKRFYDAVVLCARALLVTQGQEAATDIEALLLFRKYFIDADLTGDLVKTLVVKAIAAIQSSSINEDFDTSEHEVEVFIETIENLYKNMDDSLRFQLPKIKKDDKNMMDLKLKSNILINKEVDFRGVACPLNYVKTKIALSQMKKDELLSVLLDKNGVQNVPDSVKQDGNDVIAINQAQGYWQVIIRKM